MNAGGRLLVPAPLAQAVTTSRERRAFLRVRPGSEAGAQERYRAHLAGGQGSHVLSALALAQDLAVIPEGVERPHESAAVEVIRLDTEVE